MIVRMKRVAVLCTATSEHETLGALQSLGVLHLDADNHSEAPALKEAQSSLDNAVKAERLDVTINKLEAVEVKAPVTSREKDFAFENGVIDFPKWEGPNVPVIVEINRTRFPLQV